MTIQTTPDDARAASETISYGRHDGGAERIAFMRLRDCPEVVGPVVGRSDNSITIEIPTMEDITRTPDAFEPVAASADLTEAELLTLEAAMDHGFRWLDRNGTVYVASPAQIVTLMRAAREQGRSDAALAPPAPGGSVTVPSDWRVMAIKVIEAASAEWPADGRAYAKTLSAMFAAEASAAPARADADLAGLVGNIRRLFGRAIEADTRLIEAQDAADDLCDAVVALVESSGAAKGEA